MVNARERGRSCLKDTVSVWDDEKVLEVHGGDGSVSWQTVGWLVFFLIGG